MRRKVRSKCKCCVSSSLQEDRPGPAAPLPLATGTGLRLRLKYYAPPHNGGQNFCFVGCVRVNLEKILREDDQVCEFAGFERTFCFFTEACERSAKSVAANGFGDGKAL